MIARLFEVADRLDELLPTSRDGLALRVVAHLLASQPQLARSDLVLEYAAGLEEAAERVEELPIQRAEDLARLFREAAALLCPPADPERAGMH